MKAQDQEDSSFYKNESHLKWWLFLILFGNEVKGWFIVCVYFHFF